MRNNRLMLCSAALVLATGCAIHSPTGKLVDPDAPRPLPDGLVVLPYDVAVKEMGVGSVEEVPAWTAEAQRNTDAALKKLLPEFGLRRVDLPELSADEKALLDEHLALLDLVGGAALFAAQAGPAWQPRVAQFDYAIGPGLSFLADRTGERSALMVVGDDYVSSGGRVFTGVLLFALTGAVMMGAPAGVGAIVVDLRTGDLTWVDFYAEQGGASLRDPAQTEAMFRKVLQRYADLQNKPA